MYIYTLYTIPYTGCYVLLFRFDKLVYVGISSTPTEKLTILRAITRKFDLDPDCDLLSVSELLPDNLTGADLYALCAESMTNAIKRQIDLIETGNNGAEITNSYVELLITI